MTEKYFINGKMVLHFNNPFFRIIKNFYWGLNITRIARLFALIGCVPYISFVFLLKREHYLRKRLLVLQNLIKKYFIFDRLLKRNYQMRTDYLFKSGNYRGMRLKSGLPVHGQAHTY